jgi:hypothetical protein
MRRGRLPARSCRHVRVDALDRPSGRNACPSGISRSTIMSPVLPHGRTVDRDKAGRPRAHDPHRQSRPRSPGPDAASIDNHRPALDAGIPAQIRSVAAPRASRVRRASAFRSGERDEGHDRARCGHAQALAHPRRRRRGHGRARGRQDDRGRRSSATRPAPSSPTASSISSHAPRAGSRAGRRLTRVLNEPRRWGSCEGVLRYWPRWLTAAALSACGTGGSGGSASGFCDTHDCIASFYEGRGSIVRCADGEWSHSGGIQGACSYHGGVR